MTTFSGPLNVGEAYGSAAVSGRAVIDTAGSARFDGNLDTTGLARSGTGSQLGSMVLSQRTTVDHTQSAAGTIATLPNSDITEIYLHVVSAFNASADAQWATVHLGVSGGNNVEDIAAVPISALDVYKATDVVVSAPKMFNVSGDILAKVTGAGSVANPNAGNILATVHYVRRS